MKIPKSEQAKTALITGATSGIGLELAKIMASQGHPLILVSRNQTAIKQLSAEWQARFQNKIEWIAADLADPQAGHAIARELQHRAIHVDILINNAGFNEYGPFTATRLEKELEMLHVHQTALLVLTKQLLPPMIAQHYGRILNLGSIGSFAAGPSNAVYCATKAFILSFSEALSVELRGSGVTVTTLCPGATRTDFFHRAEMEHTRISRFQLMSAYAVAQAGYQGMLRGKRMVLPGWQNKALIQSLRLTPRNVTLLISKWLASPTA
ncbi:MAG: SDR family oxidoreductase [Desulfobacteraceae bacterium]|nr:MAG: SDR family oxidoreductase [Desulfobacteraceae bacterium]